MGCRKDLKETEGGQSRQSAVSKEGRSLREWPFRSLCTGYSHELGHRGRFEVPEGQTGVLAPRWNRMEAEGIESWGGSGRLNERVGLPRCMGWGFGGAHATPSGREGTLATPRCPPVAIDDPEGQDELPRCILATGCGYVGILVRVTLRASRAVAATRKRRQHS